jgi:hypothetical protein
MPSPSSIANVRITATPPCLVTCNVTVSRWRFIGCQSSGRREVTTMSDTDTTAAAGAAETSEPVAEEPAAEATEEPVAEEPAAEATEEPVAEEPAAEATEEPVAG